MAQLSQKEKIRQQALKNLHARLKWASVQFMDEIMNMCLGAGYIAKQPVEYNNIRQSVSFRVDCRNGKSVDIVIFNSQKEDDGYE